MRSGRCTSDIGYFSSRRLLAVAACLWPAIAGAQPPNPTDSDANGNTAAGTNALLNVTGLSNTAIGRDALNSNTTGSNNTASGISALFSNTTGGANTASGLGALFSNTTGNDNTASGRDALGSNTTGSNNTASGVVALTNNTTGNANTASCRGALFNNTTGKENTALGDLALFTNTNGRNNTAVGFKAGSKATAISTSGIPASKPARATSPVSVQIEPRSSSAGSPVCRCRGRRWS